MSDFDTLSLRGNQDLLADHCLMLELIERAARRRYLASACRLAGDTEAEYALLRTATKCMKEARDIHALLSEAVASHWDNFALAPQTPWPRTRSVDDMLRGVPAPDPYNYSGPLR